MAFSGFGSLRTQIILAFIVLGFVVRVSAVPSCVQSSSLAWMDTPIATQTAKFTATFDATPSRTDMDGVIGFSPSAVSGYAGLNAIVRFSPAGVMDVLNGQNYAADVSLPYVAGARYHIRMVIDPVAKTYSVYVMPPGAAEVALANNYVSRSEQAGASSFGYWATYSEIGTVSVCNMSVTIWSLAPAISQQPISETVIAGNTATFSVVASGTAPLTYQWKRNGSAIPGALSASYTTPATTSSDSGAHFTVVVSNSSGSATSNAATLAVNSPSSCVTSSQTTWTNSAIATETAQFSAAFDATPSQTDMDGVIGFAPSAVTGFSGLALIVRFSPAGTMDALNGKNYAADVSLPYVAGASYHVRTVIDLVAKTYSVYVTPPGAAEVALASNYTVRTVQSGGSSLSNWATFSEVGTVSVCSMSVTASSGTSAKGGTPTISWTPSSLSFGNVTVGTSKDLAVTIMSSGSATATISNVSISGAGFTASGVPSGLILAPGQAARLNVVFDPSATGTSTGSAVITSNASNSPTTTISLLGSGVQAAVSHSATLTWTASKSTVVGYNVYCGTNSGGPYTKLNSSLVGVMTYSDTSVTAGQTYYYMVTAVNSSNMESAYSNEVSATIP